MFDHREMLGTRKDIIGDLYRQRIELAHAQRPETDTLLNDPELLAAIAVALGRSHNIVIKASQVSRDRIDALLDHQIDQLEELARLHGYQRHDSGVVTRNR